MIDIEMKMFLTTELNEITVAYAKKVVLKPFYYKLAFGEFEINEDRNELQITELITDLNYIKASFSFLPSHLALAVMDLVFEFKNTLDKKDLTALYFLIFNENQTQYLENFENSFYDEDIEQEYNEQFGRFMAACIYQPEENFLEADLHTYLQDLAICFAEDTGELSSDENAVETVLETIENYLNQDICSIIGQ